MPILRHFLIYRTPHISRFSDFKAVVFLKFEKASTLVSSLEIENIQIYLQQQPPMWQNQAARKTLSRMCVNITTGNTKSPWKHVRNVTCLTLCKTKISSLFRKVDIFNKQSVPTLPAHEEHSRFLPTDEKCFR